LKNPRPGLSRRERSKNPDPFNLQEGESKNPDRFSRRRKQSKNPNRENRRKKGWKNRPRLEGLKKEPKDRRPRGRRKKRLSGQNPRIRNQREGPSPARWSAEGKGEKEKGDKPGLRDARCPLFGRGGRKSASQFEYAHQEPRRYPARAFYLARIGFAISRAIQAARLARRQKRKPSR